MTWRIIMRANAYKGNPSCCNLRPFEKLYTVLNKLSELVAKCCHKNKYFARNHRMCCSNHPWIPNFHHFKSDDQLVCETPCYNSIYLHPLHLCLYWNILWLFIFSKSWKKSVFNFYFFRNWKLKKRKVCLIFIFFWA